MCPTVEKAMIAVGLGQHDDALRHLEAAVQNRDPALVTLRSNAVWDPLRSDPRFQDVVREPCAKSGATGAGRRGPVRGRRTSASAAHARGPVRPILLGLAAVAVAGCEAGSAPASTSGDSLGVTIVESTAPSWAEGDEWRILEEPVVDLAETGSGDMHLFYRVGDVLRTPGGHLVVADRASNQVRVYDMAGQFMRAFGGAGEGPGEFRYLSTLMPIGNTRLLAMGSREGGPGAEFDTESGLVSTFRMPDGVRPVRHAVQSDVVLGWNDGFVWEEARHRQGLQRSSGTILRLSEDRNSAHEVASVPGREMVIVPEGDANPLLGRRSHIAPVGDGGIAVGLAEALEYSILDGHTGQVRLIARILGVSLAVTGEEVDRERQARLGPNPSEFTRDLLDRLPVPAEKPAYGSMLVDAEGNVWAGEFLGLARRDEAQDWYVWDASGVWLGMVETPARFELMRVGSDEVFGVRRDMNDVEHPQVLRLVKP